MQTSKIKKTKSKLFAILVLFAFSMFITLLLLYYKTNLTKTKYIQFENYSIELPSNYVAEKLTPKKLESITPYLDSNKLEKVYAITPIKNIPETPVVTPIIIGQFNGKNEFLIKAQINPIKYDTSSNAYYIEILTDNKNNSKEYLQQLNETDDKRTVYYAKDAVAGSHSAYDLYIVDTAKPVFILVPTHKRIRCDLEDGIDPNNTNPKLVEKCSEKYETLLKKHNPSNNNQNSYIYKESFGIYDLDAEYWNTIYTKDLINLLIK